MFFSKLHPENEDLSPKVYLLPKWPSLKLILEVKSTTKAEAVLLELVDDIKALQGERWAPTIICRVITPSMGVLSTPVTQVFLAIKKGVNALSVYNNDRLGGPTFNSQGGGSFGCFCKTSSQDAIAWWLKWRWIGWNLWVGGVPCDKILVAEILAFLGEIGHT